VIDVTKGLTDQVHALMRREAELLDELDGLRTDQRRARDRLLLEVLEVLDGARRAEQMVRDEEARSVLAALAHQVELIFVSLGMVSFAFERGVLPPMGDVQVVGTGHDPDLPPMAVLETIHAGLRDGATVLRKAAVELNRAEQREEA
jgi:hypothetical protein